jgi:hypothetical protein
MKAYWGVELYAVCYAMLCCAILYYGMLCCAVQCDMMPVKTTGMLLLFTSM